VIRADIAVVVCLLTAFPAAGGQSISPADTRIQVRGAKYVERSGNGLRMHRFRQDILNLDRSELGLNPDKARNTTGVVLAFRTESKNISLTFEKVPGKHRGAEFGVFENGKLTQEFKFPNAQETMQLHIKSEAQGSSLFEVALPSWSNVQLVEMEIDDGATLIAPATPQKIYVALGDSITHGVGQGSATHRTWPFLLSRKLDMELYNLAVGGGKISVPVGNMLTDWETIDLITILVGYNDLHFGKKSPQQYRDDYAKLLDAIRAHHPDTPIYCISLLYTKKPTNETTGHTVSEFRSALSNLAKDRQLWDKRLYFIEGEKVTSEDNLRSDRPQDPVHLGVEGAEMLADKMVSMIKKEDKRP